MNLTKVNGCYSKELRENCNSIKLMLGEPSVSTEEMIRIVKCMLEPAFINAQAKKRFIKNLETCATKVEVDKLCRDAVMHGMYYKANRKRAGA